MAPTLMGVVNVTPDSFSDGGRYAEPAAAIAHGRQLLADGADLLDVGGESTRPGAVRPSVEDELGRVIPVIEALAADAVVSVDTMRSEVAREALRAGATIVNDVSGGLADPAILDVVAGSTATYVAMHWRGHADRMQSLRDVRRGCRSPRSARELAERVVGGAGGGDHRRPAGARPRARVRQDGRPQLGAAGRPRRDRRPRVPAAGRRQPQVVPRGAARRPGRHASARRRPRGAGAAITVLLAQRGVWGIRVHDVRASRDALRVWQRLEEERWTS